MIICAYVQKQCCYAYYKGHLCFCNNTNTRHIEFSKWLMRMRAEGAIVHWDKPINQGYYAEVSTHD